MYEIHCRFIPSLLTVAKGHEVDQLVCGSEHTLALLLPSTSSSVTSRGGKQLLRRQSLPSKTSPQFFLLQSMIEKRKHDTLPRIETGGGYDNAFSGDRVSPSQSSLFQTLNPSTPLNSASLETVATDSDSVSTASNSSSALKESLSGVDLVCVSNSPPSDIVLERRGCEQILPSLKNVKINDFDEPYTLSPIDSPRTLSQQPSSSIGKLARIQGSDGTPCQSSESVADRQSPESSVALQSKSDLHPDGQPSVVASPLRGSSRIDATPAAPQINSRLTGIYSWGWNEHGNCGLGSTENVTLPQRIPVEGKVVLLAAGSGHSFALIRNCTKVAL